MSLCGEPPPPLTVPSQKQYKAGDKIKDYTIVKYLGSGSYGTVFLVENSKKEEFALKQLTLVNGEISTMLLREVSLLASTKHPNIIRLEKVLVMDDFLWLLLELGKYSLEERLVKPYNKETIAKWFMQLIDAICYMHENHIVHRDINPTNILVDATDKAKVSDFGFAKHVYLGESMTPEMVNGIYSAPELLLGSDSYDQPADMWSLGCVLAEIAIGSPAFQLSGSLMNTIFDPAPHSSSDFYTKSILNAIFRDLGVPSEEHWPGVTNLLRYPEDLSVFSSKLKVYEVPDTVDSDIKDMIQKLLVVVPEMRLTAAAAKSHPFYLFAKQV